MTLHTFLCSTFTQLKLEGHCNFKSLPDASRDLCSVCNYFALSLLHFDSRVLKDKTFRLGAPSTDYSYINVCTVMGATLVQFLSNRCNKPSWRFHVIRLQQPRWVSLLRGLEARCALLPSDSLTCRVFELAAETTSASILLLPLLYSPCPLPVALFCLPSHPYPLT